jgi:uncharacterized protein (DUF488 family)
VPARSSRPLVLTVGHSTRTLDELVAALRAGGALRVADVRRFPGSRRHPQHERAALERGLADHGIDYVWLGESLGGRRGESVPVERSPNRAWRIAAFRHYADAMSTPEFLAGVDELERLAHDRRTALLCAERLWWQCHRRLIADFLVVRGWRVVHVVDESKTMEHELSEFARVEDGRLTYPALL